MRYQTKQKEATSYYASTLRQVLLLWSRQCLFDKLTWLLVLDMPTLEVVVAKAAAVGEHLRSVRHEIREQVYICTYMYSYQNVRSIPIPLPDISVSKECSLYLLSLIHI